jgi:hypothetical protein
VLHVVQVCNVGRIVGGTAACAWTVARALFDCRRTIICLSAPDASTVRAFAGCDVLKRDRVSADDLQKLGADVVILHNTAEWRCDKNLPAVTLQYVHSRIAPASADATMYCSRWLAARCDAADGDVCVQGVPKPARPSGGGESRALRRWPVIGRICTPTARKWPVSLVDFYARLAARFPHVEWDFVGCPAPLAASIERACDDRARFFDASWSARSRLWTWDALLYHHPDLTESFGRTCAEALRAGCVPIVDRRGGFVEQVAEGCGWLCADAESFHAAVDALHDRATRRRMSRAALAHGDEAFSVRRFRGELLERMRRACEQRR